MNVLELVAEFCAHVAPADEVSKKRIADGIRELARPRVAPRPPNRAQRRRARRETRI